MHYKKTAALFLFLSWALLMSSDEYRSHTVKRNETLYGIARTYNTSVQDLTHLNNLDGEIIRPGQVLKIPPLTLREYTVKPGDSLEKIARTTGAEPDRIIKINHLKGDIIIAGDKLWLPRTPKAGEVYTVREGDSLSWIALLYGITVKDLEAANNISSGVAIQPGLRLALPEPDYHLAAVQPPPLNHNSNIYLVREGDTLWGLSRKWGVTVSQIIEANGLTKEILYKNQKLKIPARPPLIPHEKSRLTGYYGLLPSDKSLDHGTGPYFNWKPKAISQLSDTYGEEYRRNPEDNYRRATALLASFDKSVQNMGSLSPILKGYTIVLDPGHGGDDPGFVVSSTNQRGETVYLVEDEYNYDIALRVYRLLVLHGAKVQLTVISPNHHIRRTPDPSLTFVNEKNEVFNNFTLNKPGAEYCFPDGNRSSLQKRKIVAAAFFDKVPVRKRLFVSIHSDNNPGLDSKPCVLFSGLNPSETAKNRLFAEAVAKGMGHGIETREQSVCVLQDNPASAAILIEVRNIHYPENSWALRNDESREKDAIQIVDGIIHYVKTLK